MLTAFIAHNLSKIYQLEAYNSVYRHVLSIPKKTPEKSETVINTCLSIIKQHWKKVEEIPQKHDFLTWSIQDFVKKGNRLLENIILFD